MSATEAALCASLISSGSAICLAVISRLRFRCMPDRETGECVCQSGCSEVPLPGADENEIVTHQYDLTGRSALIVTARGEKQINWKMPLLPKLPCRRLYIDSRFAEGTATDFTVNLPEAGLDLPDNCVAYVDAISVPSIQNVFEGKNRIYYE